MHAGSSISCLASEYPDIGENLTVKKAYEAFKGSVNISAPMSHLFSRHTLGVNVTCVGNIRVT
jgi:hypothetical protein